METTNATAKWTVATYHRAIALGMFARRQVEFVSGEIVEMSPEGPVHASTYRKGLRYLQQMLGDRAEVLPATPILLPDVNSESQPDLAIARPPLERYDDRHPSPADIFWLVEVSQSTISYDLGTKARLYAAASIVEYWVIDVRSRRLWIHRQPVEGEYRSRVTAMSGTVSPLAFPDIALSVEQILG